MKITHVKGNTYVIEASQLIPIYKTDETHFILLDTGLYMQRDKIEQAFKEAGLTPAGILGSHAHVDHSGNHAYFRRKYNIPVCMSLGEAGMSVNESALKLNYSQFNLEHLRKEPRFHELIFDTDVIIMPDVEEIEFCGVRFKIIHVPGHTIDQIAVITPDNVMYVADACLSKTELDVIKIPYNLCVEQVVESMEKLKEYKCDKYIFAHYDVKDEIGPVVDYYRQRINQIIDDIYSLVEGEMTEEELMKALCVKYGMLSSRPDRVPLYQRFAHSYFEYLLDLGRLEMTAHEGISYYRRVE
ncbi:MAG: MBL fold metallo-hydrolase [Lachnospiraceae bacterium]|nr:MBL fold metallo-hydrolase [Lachnospiraceae bacterium]